MTTGSAVGHRIRVGVAWALALLLLLVVVALAWTQTVHMGEREAALDAWRNESISIESDDARIVMAPTGDASDAGLVFVPGARVDPYAYMAKLADVAASGVTVVIAKPVLNLALADQRPLTTFTAGVPSVARWFVGGHSLGGVRACMLAPDAEGLILFASYCATDLSGSSVPVLSLSGSNDGLSTPEKIASARHLLPDDACFVEIDGANHASFGDYGSQPGDGSATIDDEHMTSELTKAVLEFVAGEDSHSA